MARLPKGTPGRAGPAARRNANVTEPAQQLIDATAVRWWRWRHCYLEAMQLALDERTLAVAAAGAAADGARAAQGTKDRSTADSTP